MSSHPFPLNIVYADADLPSLFGVAILHYVIWYFLSPFVVNTAKAWVEPKKQYVEQINKNFVEESKAYGITPPEYWAIAVRAFCHHGTGGVLMLLGMYLDQPFLWRHGLMTEVGGMDMLDISQMIVTKLGFPIEPWATKYGTPAWILLGCHHTCGLLTGFPVCLYFSDISNYQWIGLILLGGPAPFMLIQAYDGLLDHEAVSGSWFHLGCAIVEFALMFHQRVLMLTPLAFSCISHAHGLNGYGMSIPLGAGFGFITIIDIVFVLTTLKCVVLAVTQGHFTPGHTRKILRMAAATSAHQRVSMLHHHTDTQVLIAHKLHKWGMRAKASAAAKKSS